MLQSETRRNKKGKNEKCSTSVEMAVRNGAFLILGICRAKGEKRLTRIPYSTICSMV
jgi:hypothetical protein